jgi:hypothetical protein
MPAYVEASAAGVAGAYCSIDLDETGERSLSGPQIKSPIQAADDAQGDAVAEI